MKSQSIDSSDQSDSTAIYASAGEKHVPVLLQEALELLNIRPDHLYIDATAGGGGHLSGILESLPDGATTQAAPTKTQAQDGKQEHAGVIAVDRDLAALSRLRERFGNRAQFWHCTYDRIKERLHDQGILTVNGGILADLGVSSMQIDNPARGFSFMQDGPLDMRMDQNQSLSAEELINSLSEEELANIIFNYGEERFSRAIARGIVRARPLHTTGELSDVVMRSLRHQKQRISSSSKKRQTLSYSTHPATRTFQAIRIAVNDELNCLKKFLDDSLSILAPGARLVVITFHSLEDRVVKQFLRQAAASCLCPPKQLVCTCHHKPQLLIITRKPIVAGEKEVLANVRSRSAKLRAGEML